MVCIFCLNETSDDVSLYGASELAKHARNVVVKHFWFDVNEINSPEKYSCWNCWQTIETFYYFYGMVESNYPNILNVIDATNDLVSQSLDNDTKSFVKETVIVKVENDGLDSCSAESENINILSPSKFDVKVEIHEMAVELNDNSNTASTSNDAKELEKKANRNTSNASPTFQEHKKTAKFYCEICRRQFSRSGLIYHMPVHDPEERFILECDLCGKKFSRKFTILAHLKAHQRWKQLDKTTLSVPCPICKKVMSRMNVRTHILRMHENIKSIKHVCEVCGIGFSTPSLLAEHATTHIDRSLTEVQCNICGKWLKNQKALNRHKKSHKQAPQMCPHPNCDKLTYNTNEMKTHLSQFHAKHKHQCSICQKSFIRPIRLREHIASAHTGERAYNCLYCAKAFKTNSVRFRHMQDQHSREYNLDREKRTPK